MRPSLEARLATWPTRILRPWLVASAAGFSIGTLLLSFEPPDSETGYSNPAHSPRPAMYDTRPALVTDPFAPSSPLAAPPDAPPASAAPLPAATEGAASPEVP
jgi:hypothetical protein